MKAYTNRAPSLPAMAQRGFALVVVLWLVALLALMAVSHSALQRTETGAAANLLQGAQARAAAQSGIQLAILDLMRQPAVRVMSSDGMVHTMQLGEATLYLAIVDEAGKVDLNFASGPLLDALVSAGGVEDELERVRLVDAILDWRDSDKLRRIHGAEEEEYLASGRGYPPRNGPFQSLEELALVLGMNASLYHRLSPAITIFSGASGINSTAAAGTLLTQLSANVDEIVSIAVEENESDTAQVAASSRAAAAGQVFSIRCEAILPGNVRDQLEAVVRLIPRRGTATPLYETLLWREVVDGTTLSSGQAPF